jgi:hypothetical protein
MAINSPFNRNLGQTPPRSRVYGVPASPERSSQFQQLRQREQMFPYELGQSAFNLGRGRAMLPYEIGSAQANIAATQFSTSRGQQLLPYELGQSQLGLERGQYELGELRAGESARAAERAFAEAQAKSRLAFLPQFEQARSAVAGRIASNVNRPQAMNTQNWMQSYSVPEFAKPKAQPKPMFRPQAGNKPLTQFA